MGKAKRALRRVGVLLALATVAMLTMGAGEAFGGNVKVCKQISAGSLDSLRSKTFSFSVTTNHPSYPGPYAITGVRGGECRLLTSGWMPLNIPHLRPNGTPTRVTVSEQPVAGVVVGDVTVAGSRGNIARSCTVDGSGRQTCQPWIAFDLGPYTNTVTFLNRMAPI